MINIGAGVANIVNSSMGQGIGSAIKQNSIKQVTKTWKKETPIIQGRPYKKICDKAGWHRRYGNCTEARKKHTGICNGRYRRRII